MRACGLCLQVAGQQGAYVARMVNRGYTLGERHLILSRGRLHTSTVNAHEHPVRTRFLLLKHIRSCCAAPWGLPLLLLQVWVAWTRPRRSRWTLRRRRRAWISPSCASCGVWMRLPSASSQD